MPKEATNVLLQMFPLACIWSLSGSCRVWQVNKTVHYVRSYSFAPNGSVAVTAMKLVDRVTEGYTLVRF